MSKLHLAVDNVSELPVGNLMDIAGMARRFADDIDANKHGDVLRVVVVVQDESGSMSLFGWGENTNDLELMGLFEAAKLRVFAEQVIDD